MKKIHTMVNIVVKCGQLIMPIHLTLVLIFTFIVIIFHNFVRHSHCTKLKRAPWPFPSCPLLGNFPFLHKLPHQGFYNLLKYMEISWSSSWDQFILSSSHLWNWWRTHDQTFSFCSLHMNASKHGSNEEISSLMHNVFEDCKVICFNFSR